MIRQRFGLLSGVGWIFAGQLVSLGCAVVSMSLLARGLGPAGTGLYAVAILVPTSLTLLFGGGLGAANVYFAGSTRLAIRDLTQNAVAIAVAGTALAGVAIGALWWVGILGLILPGITPAMLAMGLVILPVLMLRQAFNAIVLGLQQLSRSARVDMAQAVAMLAGVLILVGVIGVNAAGAMVAYLLGVLIAVTVLVSWLRSLGARFVPQWRRTVAGPTISYGYRATAGSIAQIITYRLDLILVNVWIGSAVAGEYSIATRLAELLWLLPAAIGTVVFSRSSSTRGDQMNAITPRAFAATFVISSAGAIALAVTGPWLIPFMFSDQFSASYGPMLVLLPGAVLLGSSGVLANDLAGRGHPGLVSLAAVAGCFVTIPLDLLLIRSYGAIGAALASSIAYAMYFGLIFVAYLRVSARDRAIGMTLAVGKR
jgi:O-antigen/teichoic acid export membrane protein